MAARDADHGSGAVRGTLALVLVLALVAGGVAVWHYDLLDRWLDDAAAPADPSTDPVAVAPPPGVEVPEVVAPPAVAAAASLTRPVAAGVVRRTLRPYLRDADLGDHVLAEVAPLEGGPAVFTRGGGADTATPASTTKVVTTTAALLALGPDHVFTTETRLAGRRLSLVGGGDPFLERAPRDLAGRPWAYPARADLATLATETAAALAAAGVPRVRLSYDDSLFAGDGVNPAWEPDYVPDGVVSPTTALWVDEGRAPSGAGRVADPSAEAAAAFAAALATAGVEVVGAPTAAPAPDVEPLAAVDSAPLSQIVSRILDVSDNEASEVLLRHVGLAAGGDGSITAGSNAVRRSLTDAGVPWGDSVFHDGSGLSRRNRADPSTLLGVLRLAASPDHPDLRAVVTGLPVAAFTGSLTNRMDAGPPAGRGRVHAKTGTLTGVRSLAGIATTPDGTVLAFVLMADRIAGDQQVQAQTDLDSAAAALGACDCGR